MSLSIIRLLALPIAFALLSGCKLAVEVGEGGQVLSASGSRDCAESSVCEHTVTDTNFNETFTAVAKPGYTFSHWMGGNVYICADSKELTCTTDNTGLSGNTDAESVIASAAVFKIRPVFKLASRAPYVVKDGNGEVIADVIEIRSNQSFTDSVRARFVHVDEAGVEHGYAVLVNKHYIYSDMSDYGAPLYLDSDCSGQPYASGQFVDSLMGPLISNRMYHWGEPPEPVKLAILASDEPVYLPFYRVDWDGCSGPSEARSDGIYPLTMVNEDLNSSFTPPFGLFAE